MEAPPVPPPLGGYRGTGTGPKTVLGDDMNEPIKRTLTLPYPPSANRYWRVWRGRAVTSDEARAYKLTIAHLFKATPLEGLLSVDLAVCRPRRSGDLDNRIKVTLDALRGIAFVDDSQIVAIHATRHEDKANPRVEVVIRSAS